MFTDTSASPYLNDDKFYALLNVYVCVYFCVYGARDQTQATMHATPEIHIQNLHFKTSNFLCQERGFSVYPLFSLPRILFDTRSGLDIVH